MGRKAHNKCVSLVVDIHPSPEKETKLDFGKTKSTSPRRGSRRGGRGSKKSQAGRDSLVEEIPVVSEEVIDQERELAVESSSPAISEKKLDTEVTPSLSFSDKLNMLVGHFNDDDEPVSFADFEDMSSEDRRDFVLFEYPRFRLPSGEVMFHPEDPLGRLEGSPSSDTTELCSVSSDEETLVASETEEADSDGEQPNDALHTASGACSTDLSSVVQVPIVPESPMEKADPVQLDFVDPWADEDEGEQEMEIPEIPEEIFEEFSSTFPLTKAVCLSKKDKGHGYYRSHTGLFKPGVATPVVHPFLRPIELLANSKKLVWDAGKQIVRGKGRSINLHDRWMTLKTLTPLTIWEKDALRAEDLLKYWNAQRDDAGNLVPFAKSFFKRLRILDFQRCVVDGLFMGMHVAHVRLCSRQCRFLRRFITVILKRPVQAARELKRWAGIARSWYFGDKSVPLPFLLQGVWDRHLLHFSYLGRALPPPPKDDSLMDEYVQRLTSEPPPQHPLWRSFCRDYFEQLPVDPDTVEYRTDASVSATFAYGREEGGFTSAVQDLVSLGFCLLNAVMQSSSSDTEEDLYRRYPTLHRFPPGLFDILVDICSGYPWSQKGTRFDGPPKEKMDPMFNPWSNHWPREWKRQEGKNIEVIPSTFDHISVRVTREKFYSDCLRAATHFTLLTVDQIPLLPIYAEEKGLKVRYPATTLAAATLVYQMWRRAIDSHMVKDPKHSNSLGGPIPLPVQDLRPARGEWKKTWSGEQYFYSQDMSFATDLHPHWLTRGAYDAIVPYHPALAEWVPYFDKLFGPHKIINLEGLAKSEILQKPEDTIKATKIGALDRQARHPLTSLSGSVPHIYLDSCWNIDMMKNEAFINSWDTYLKNINSADCPLSTTSASMGDATSFPIMPLLTEFCARQAGIDSFITAGDDAVLAGMTPDKQQIFEDTVKTCGGVLSLGDPVKGKPNKIFKHPTRMMFCEAVYQLSPRTSKIHIVPTMHLSLWTAPPGGSKGSVDWFNQPSSVRQHCENVGLPLNFSLWSKTKTYHQVRAAFKLGIPVGADYKFGGIYHPMYDPSRAVSKHETHVWLNAVSQLDKFDLALGTGLSVLPSGASGLSLKATKEALKKLDWQILGQSASELPGHLISTSASASEDKIFLEHAADVAMRITSSWELYNRKPPRALRTPSIATIAGKYRRAIRRYPRVGDFEYEPTMNDVAVKSLHYVEQPVLDVWLGNVRGAKRAYGLRESRVSKATRAQAQWQHLADLRVDRAYLRPKGESSLRTTVAPAEPG